MTPQDKKQQAIELRAAGQTYQQIAESTGYSVDWCKKNLKDVEKNKDEKEAIKQAVKIAQSVTGITVAEIKYLVRSIYPQDGTKESQDMEEKAIKRFKAAIKKQPNTLIRPYWMQPENARISFNMLMSSVDNVMISLSEQVSYFRRELDLDSSYDLSIRYAIIKLLYGSGLTPEGVETHCDRLNDIVLMLEERNSDTGTDEGMHFMHSINTYTQKCAPNFPEVEKCIVQDYTFSDSVEECDFDSFMSAMNESF
jgi:hypothetical protein